MSNESGPINGQSILEENSIENGPVPRKGKKSSHGKPTDNQVQRRGHLKQSELIKWSVFVRQEVKIAVQKAAKKAGITDTAWLDSALWEKAMEELGKKVQPPTKPEDVADIIKQFADNLKAEQKTSREAQDELIRQQNQQIESLKHTVEAAINKPQPGIMQMIFGNKKDK